MRHRYLMLPLLLLAPTCDSEEPPGPSPIVAWPTHYAMVDDLTCEMFPRLHDVEPGHSHGVGGHELIETELMGCLDMEPAFGGIEWWLEKPPGSANIYNTFVPPFTFGSYWGRTTPRTETRVGYDIPTGAYRFRWRQEDPACALAPGEEQRITLTPTHLAMVREGTERFDCTWRWAEPGPNDGCGFTETGLQGNWWATADLHGETICVRLPEDDSGCVPPDVFQRSGMFMFVDRVRCTFTGPDAGD